MEKKKKKMVVYRRCGQERTRTTHGQRGNRNGVVTKAVFVPSAARAAYRMALVYVLPGRRVLLTASRMAGARVILLVLCGIQLVLSALLFLEKRFGLKDRIVQTLSYKKTIGERIHTLENRDGMLRAILNKTRRNLSSMSTMDGSDDEEEEEEGGDSMTSMYGDKEKRGEDVLLCSLCGGTGTINYEGKYTHTNEPCPKCLGSGHHP